VERAFRAREGEQIAMKRALLVSWEETWYDPARRRGGGGECSGV